MALARLSRKFIQKLRYTAERPKVAESYSPLAAAPRRAPRRARRGEYKTKKYVPVHLCMRAYRSRREKIGAAVTLRCVASRDSRGSARGEPHGCRHGCVHGRRAGAVGLWCVLYRQKEKLSQIFCESCRYVVRKNERKVALTCNKSLAKAKRGVRGMILLRCLKCR